MGIVGTKTWIEVSRAALRHNAAELRRTIGPKVKLMAVVKSNAYGHGIEQTVKSVGSMADWFGVDSLPEAKLVRRAGSKRPVLILGYTPLDQLKEAVANGFSLTVYEPRVVRQLARLSTAARPAKIHLKIETGTSRQGVLPDEMAALVKIMRGGRHLRLEGISTHYANIEDTTDPTYAMTQLRRFKEAALALQSLGFRPAIRHTACSAAALLYPETRFDLVRTGISLYGLWSSELTRRSLADAGADIDLRPAMTWKTIIAQAKRLPKGTPISYGLTERLTKNSMVAIIPAGYWDGLDRRLSSQGQVLIRGRRAKILGRVCMNMCVIDVTGIKGAKAEDEVVLLGRQGRERVSAEEIACRLGTINYEVVTRINPILPRILVDRT